MYEYFFVGRRCFRLALYFALEFAQHDELVRFRGSLCPIDLQIAQHQRAFPILLEENERISDKNTSRIEHIRIGVAGRNNEASELILLCHETTVGSDSSLPMFPTDDTPTLQFANISVRA